MGLFSMFKTTRGDAFAAREKQQKVWQHIRRIVDLSTPNAMSEEESQRSWKRYNRCLLIACVPMNTEELDASSIFYGSTKDFSDNGVSLITSQFVECTDCICGFWLDDILLLQGIVRHVRPFGGNLYEVGIEFTEVVESAAVISVLRDELEKSAPNSDKVMA